MTERELAAEHEVEYLTELGMLCGGLREATEEEKDLARKAADKHIRRLRFEASIAEAEEES